MDSSIIATMILGFVGILITFYYSRHSKKIADEKMLKELFKEFNTRYDALNGYLLEIENKYPTIDKFREAANHDELEQKVIDYFNLCAEEYFWYYHKNRIDKLIWGPWNSGMNYWYKKVSTIHELWKKEVDTKGRSTYYLTNKNGFFNE